VQMLGLVKSIFPLGVSMSIQIPIVVFRQIYSGYAKGGSLEVQNMFFKKCKVRLWEDFFCIFKKIVLFFF